MGGVSTNGRPPEPDWLKAKPDSIPDELKALPQFLVWKGEFCDGRWTKPPYNARNGNAGSSTNPDTWSSFEDAKWAYEHGEWSGIGITMFSGLAGVDLDKCVNLEIGEIAEWAMLVVRAFNSYTERSPSGTGLRILFNAKLPGPGLNRTVRGMHVEIYDGGRYLTLTGHHIDGTPKTIEPRQEAASQFYQWILDGTEPKKQPTDRPVLDPNQKGKDLTDAEVMDCCLNSANGEKFEKLWDGDIGDYKDDTHPDGNPSRADAAMAGILCYHSLDDEQVARLWRGSKLYREKLDRQDYIDRTIGFIRKGQTDACANALPKKDAIKLRLMGIPRVASEFDDIVLLLLTHLEPIVTEEDKLTLIALISVFNGRKIAAVSRGLLARRIRRLDGNGTAASSKTLDQFGGRRLTNLKKALKRSLTVPVLTLVEHSKKRGFYKGMQKPKASRYQLDLEIFREALALARHFYDEWCDGKPRFKEWRGNDSYQPKPNPGKCREKAALLVARKYSNLDQSEKTVPGKPKPDEFSRWVGAEKDLLRDARKWADAFDDLGKTTQDRRIFAGRLLDQIKPILLQDGKRERRRLLLKLKQDTENIVIEASFMHEGIVSEGENTPDYSPSPVVSVNTNGDKAIQDETEQIEARRVAIRSRFIEIQPFGSAVFVARENSDEVIALAEEMDALDERLAELRAQGNVTPADEYDIIPPLMNDPLVDSLLDDMEAF